MSAVPTAPLAYPGPPLSDGVVVLRPWALTDSCCVKEASRDPYIPHTTTVPRTFTQVEGHAWIDRQLGRATHGKGWSLAITRATGEDAFGSVNLRLSRRPGVAEIGYWVIEPARGDGLASRAVELISTWALRTRGLARVEALVEPDNIISQRVLERVGFRREGLLRSYLDYEGGRTDAVMYSRLAIDLSEAEALALAVAETREVRRRRRA